MNNNLNENVESSLSEEQIHVDAGINNQPNINSNIDETSTKQLSSEKSNNTSNDRKNNKHPGKIIMIIITVLYMIVCILFIKQDLSSDAMFSGLGTAFIIAYGPIGLGIIWGIYGLWLFLYKKFSAKKFAGIKSFVIIAAIIGVFLTIIIWGPLLFYSIKSGIEESKTSQKGKISSIERESVCIKENNNYVSYIVADNKYAFTSNSLLVRKNALNKKLRYHKSEEKDDYGYYKYERYDNTLIDEYLTSNEWINRFDKDFLAAINTTSLYQSYSFTDYKISRKFFIISTDEYFGFHTDAEWDKMALSGGMPDDWSYYYTEDHIYDDNGNIVNYWIVRIDDQNNDIHKCNSEGCCPLDYDDNSEYYFRPAFTISNNTKIIKNSNNNYDCKWLIDVNSN